MRRHDQVDQDNAKIEDVLDRVHGHAGPWAGIDVLVMQIVHRLIERLPMNEAMNPIEMEFAPKRNGAKPYGKIDGMLRPVYIWEQTVGPSPHEKHLVGGPDRAAAGAAPKDVVVNLISEKKRRTGLALPTRIVLLLRALQL